MAVKEYDLIIIGAGPAGLTAGIYGARAGLRTGIIEKGLPGGLATATDLIENFPGFPTGIKGSQLGELMLEQATRFGVEIISGQVTAIKKNNSLIHVKASGSCILYSCTAVIIATGTLPKMLNVPGESELRGKGVTYCATCDGPLFKGKDIAVIGCGNSGLQEGRFLLNFARNIFLIEFLTHVTADKVLQDELEKEPRAKFFLNHEVVSINGQSHIESVTIRNRKDNKEQIINVNGVFIYVGLMPNTTFLDGILELNDAGFIITSENFETSIAGIYAAGDVRAKKFRQVVTACSEGAEAAMNAFQYIKNKKKQINN